MERDFFQSYAAASVHSTLQPLYERDWGDEVIALYVADVDMEADEFERLLDVALRGQKPNHPNLPAYLPVEGMEMGRELR